MTDEVKQVGAHPTTDATNPMSSYLPTAQDEISRLNAARDAYANKRVMNSSRSQWPDAKIARRVILGAIFYPAHPSRMRILGPGRGKKYKYFVLHRPGRIFKPGQKGYRFRSQKEALRYALKACSNAATIFTFRQAKGPPASTHFIIGLDGSLVQMIDLDDLSMHTRTKPHPNPLVEGVISNSNSIGVELEGPVQDATDKRLASPFTDVQMQTLARVIRIMHDINPGELLLDSDHILDHSTLDPRRKTDPGPNFNVQRIVSMAQSVQQYSAFYQAPIDLASAEALAANTFGNLGVRTPIPQFRAVMRGVAARMTANVRASNMRLAGRDIYYTAATRDAENRIAADGEDLAGKMRQGTVYSQTELVSQERRESLAFDYTTGEWNDTTQDTGEG